MSYLFILSLFLTIQTSLASRNLLIRDLPDIKGSVCNNTFGGRWYLADNLGRVCHRDGFDYGTGCCSTGSQYSCDTCEGDQCCSSYPHCVSCCLSPQHSGDRRLQSTYRGYAKPETGTWATAFDYCRSVCRTSSRSTQHENAFILDRRYCFSPTGRPHQPLPKPPPLPTNVTAHNGKPGESCMDTCRAVGKQCVADGLASVNNCNIMRELFPCEAGCSTNAKGQEYPGYVSAKSPKWQWPALCLVVPDVAAAAKQYNCSASQSHVHRVCTCKDNPLQQPTLQLGRPGELGGAGVLNRRVGTPFMNASRPRDAASRATGHAGAGAITRPVGLNQNSTEGRFQAAGATTSQAGGAGGTNQGTLDARQGQHGQQQALHQ